MNEFNWDVLDKRELVFIGRKEIKNFYYLVRGFEKSVIIDLFYIVF